MLTEQRQETSLNRLFRLYLFAPRLSFDTYGILVFMAFAVIVGWNTPSEVVDPARDELERQHAETLLREACPRPNRLEVDPTTSELVCIVDPTEPSQAALGLP